MTVQSRTSRTEIDALEMSQKVEAHTKTGRNGNYRCRAEPPRAENVFTPAGEAPVLGCLTGYRLCVSVCVCVCPCCILLMFTLSFAYQTTVVYIGGGMPEEDHIA